MNSLPPNSPYGPAPDPYGVNPPPLPPIEPPQPQRARPADREGLKSILSTVLILLAAPLIALALTAFVFQSYEVDGPSMEPTLHNHDRLIVLKTARTLAGLTGNGFVPERGDIIVFSKDGSRESGSDRDKQLIKRVLGLPGERVVVQGGVLTVYNMEHPQGYEPDETLPYDEAIRTTPGNVDLVVPAGEVFVVGDNRTNSQDSRFFGTVSTEDIVGTLALRILPLNKARTF